MNITIQNHTIPVSAFDDFYNLPLEIPLAVGEHYLSFLFDIAFPTLNPNSLAFRFNFSAGGDAPVIDVSEGSGSAFTGQSPDNSDTIVAGVPLDGIFLTIGPLATPDTAKGQISGKVNVTTEGVLRVQALLTGNPADAVLPEVSAGLIESGA